MLKFPFQVDDECLITWLKKHHSEILYINYTPRIDNYARSSKLIKNIDKLNENRKLFEQKDLIEITITGPTQMVKNRGYIANNAARVGLTLPTTSEVGDYVLVVCKGDGGFRIVQGAGQRIFFDDIYTTSGAGGYIDSTYENDTVKLICIQADTLWTVSYAVGELQVV